MSGYTITQAKERSELLKEQALKYLTGSLKTTDEVAAHLEVTERYDTALLHVALIALETEGLLQADKSSSSIREWTWTLK